MMRIASLKRTGSERPIHSNTAPGWCYETLREMHLTLYRSYLQNKGKIRTYWLFARVVNVVYMQSPKPRANTSAVGRTHVLHKLLTQEYPALQFFSLAS